MTETLDGIFISFNDEQPRKALWPIDITEGGISISFNNKHPSKALSHIDSIEGGIEIFVNVEQQAKDSHPILFIKEFGRIVIVSILPIC